MNVVRHPAPAAADTLLVLLPGAYMTPQHFVDAGFVAARDAQGAALDLAIAGLDLAEISGGAALPAVRDAIVRPARRDYRRVWLGGISLGGFLALLYAARHADEVDGLCLFAPYPGSRITTGAIAAAGGLAAWTPTPEQRADPEFELWAWLQSDAAKPPVHIDYGRDDRFADGIAQLAAALPQACVGTRPGGHDWPVWAAAWNDFLAAGRPAIAER
ncbi:alpha/beta hydrolase-fold protein [Azospira restricta]|uniref:Alpha/beta hydrolase n=1 Tax=Azospira restricta TaxID=404405 RepID=A0A974SQR7_9RHOO|nr:alpha/beta hydrolase-fold protein [Azospira restricta]QRJ64750.1 hypothetical protein IWH25_05215 [Azospira restricta]